MIVESERSFPPGDHAAIRKRNSIAEIHADGYIEIRTSSQAPFVISIGKITAVDRCGTEIVTFARTGHMHPVTVIGLNGTPECRVFERHSGAMLFAAGVSLNQVIDNGDSSHYSRRPLGALPTVP